MDLKSGNYVWRWKETFEENIVSIVLRGKESVGSVYSEMERG